MTEQDPGRAGVVGRVLATVDRVRARWPIADHAVRTVDHMGRVQGGMLAGGVTYYGYLSFFPVLAIAFAIIGFVVEVYAGADEVLVAALTDVFPGLVGPAGGDEPIKISTFSEAAGTAGLVGGLGLLYSGLGWISALRASLQAVFEVAREEQRNFVLGKLVDLLALAVIGVVLIVSVALSSAAATLTGVILDWLLLGVVPTAVNAAAATVGVLLGLLASTLLFFAIFTLLTTAQLPRLALAKGAVVAALGFEVLKLLASTLIKLAGSNPATAILGTSLVLLVWINYFSRVTMYGAAWAYTSPEARAVRDQERQQRDDEHERRRVLAERRARRRQRDPAPVGSPSTGSVAPTPTRQRRIDRVSVAAGMTAGAAAGGVATALALVVRRGRR